MEELLLCERDLLALALAQLGLGARSPSFRVEFGVTDGLDESIKCQLVGPGGKARESALTLAAAAVFRACRFVTATVRTSLYAREKAAAPILSLSSSKHSCARVCNSAASDTGVRENGGYRAWSSKTHPSEGP